MTIKQAEAKGLRILDAAPEGWRKLEGATTAPKGYSWFTNGKSLWSPYRKTALVKDRED